MYQRQQQSTYVPKPRFCIAACSGATEHCAAVKQQLNKDNILLLFAATRVPCSRNTDKHRCPNHFALCSLRTDRTSASTTTAGDVRTISGPISGRSGARVVERSAALAQHRIAPAGPVVNSTAEQRPRFVGQEDYRFLGAWGESAMCVRNAIFRYDSVLRNMLS